MSSNRGKEEKKIQATKKMVRITMELKKEIVGMYEGGMCIRDLAAAYRMPRTTVSTIVKNKDVIKSAYVAMGVKSISKQRSWTLEHVEKLLLLWITERQCAGESVSEAVICEKAKQMHADLLKNQAGTSQESSKVFKASHGWFENFKKRIGIHSVLGHAEEEAIADKDADEEEVKAHFDSSQFESNRLDGRKLLKPFAVPEIFSRRPVKPTRKAPHRREVKEKPMEIEICQKVLDVEPQLSAVEMEGHRLKVFENNAEVVIPDREILQDSASSSMQAYDYPITIIDETRPLVETPNQLKKELQQRDVMTEGRTAETSPPFLQSESSTEEQNNHSNEDDSNRQKKRKRRHNDNNSAVDAVSDKHSTLKMALSAISKNNDECQTFGNFVASSLRNLKSDANRRKLRLAIQKVILDISTLDDKDN